MSPISLGAIPRGKPREETDEQAKYRQGLEADALNLRISRARKELSAIGILPEWMTEEEKSDLSMAVRGAQSMLQLAERSISRANKRIEAF